MRLSLLERLKLWWRGYHVVCDGRNNTDEDVEEGRIVANVFMTLPKQLEAQQETQSTPAQLFLQGLWDGEYVEFKDPPRVVNGAGRVIGLGNTRAEACRQAVQWIAKQRETERAGTL